MKNFQLLFNKFLHSIKCWNHKTPLKLCLIKSKRVKQRALCDASGQSDKISDLIWASGRQTGPDRRPHPVDETLHEPLGAVDPCRHLLPVLQGGNKWNVINVQRRSATSALMGRRDLTICFFSLGRSLERIWSWWAWNLWSLGNPGTKKPRRQGEIRESTFNLTSLTLKV